MRLTLLVRANAMTNNRAEHYRQLAQDCMKLANQVPGKDRAALLEMASEWERLADQAQWATDLREKQGPSIA
jgi:hypothetical protein